MKNIAVVGYPRSGNQWTAWVCMYLTGTSQVIPSHGWNTPLGSQLPDNVPVVFSLRNYKECMVRHCEHRGGGISEDILSLFFAETMSSPHANYVSLMRAFHGYRGPKFLNRYEDMILDPREQALKLSWFLDADRAKTRSLMDDWNMQMTLCISNSHGATFKEYKPIEHSLLLSHGIRMEWDRMIEMAVGKDIWDMYLRTYAENQALSTMGA